MTTPCDAIVLCAELGTRLRPLTNERPKPAVPLLNRPLVGYAFGLVKTLGLTSVAINTHWLPAEMERFARAEAERLGLTLGVSHEPEILGTGGGLRQARERLGIGRERPLLVLNGDVLFDLDLASVLDTHVASGAHATMVLRPLPPGASYAPVEADETGRIHRVRTFGEAGRGPGRLFSGVHVLSPEALDLLPEGPSDVVESVYAALLASGARVQAASGPGLWLDLGDPKGYLDAHLSLLSGDVAPGILQAAAILPDLREAMHPEAMVEPTAIVERSCIGPGARVGDGARVIESVVWPGAEVETGEMLVRTIVTPKVRVHVE